MASVKIGKSLKSLITTINEDKNIGPDYLFISELYKSILMTAAKDKRTPSPSFKPSSMKCCRNMQYQIMQVPPEVTTDSAQMVGIAESGTDRHIRIQQAIMKMKENGFDCEYISVGDFVRQRQQNNELLDLEIIDDSGIECKLYNKKYNISFMCDGILLFHNKYYIFEFKTETTMKNSKRTDMAEEHIPQICAYYLSFNIPNVMMLYENRDTLEKKAYYKVVTDEMVFDNVISKIELVNSCLTTGEIARGTVGNHCKYCSYKSRCRIDGNGF